MSVPRPDARRAPGAALVVAFATGGVALSLFPPGLNPFGPAKFVMTCALAALACLVLALDPVARMRARAAFTMRIAIAAVALGALAVLSLAGATDIRLAIVGAYPSYTGLIAAGAWFAIAACAAGAAPGDARRFAGRGAVVALCGIGAYAVLQRFGIDPMPASAAFDSGRAASTLGNAANLGAYVAIALVFAADRFVAEEGLVWRIVSGAALVLGAVSAGFSGSRGAWLAVAFGLAGWVAITRSADRMLMRRSGAVVAAIAAVSLLAVIVTPVASTRINGGGTASATARGRLEVWSSTASMIGERPFLGVGPSGFGLAHTLVMTPAEVDPRGRVEALADPHNIILSAAVTTGVPGALVLVSLGAFAFAGAWRARAGAHGAWAAALAGSLTALVVAMQFHFVTLDTGAIAAVIVGAIAALEQPETVRVVGTQRLSAPLFGAAVACACLSLLATGGATADAFLGSGFAAAERGAWSEARTSFAVAGRLAFWEPSVTWATGRAATDAVTAGAPQALDDGAAALRSAEKRMPGDSRVPRDLGDLFLAGAVTGGPDTLWSDALAAYDRALTLAPTDPRAWLGKGVAEAGSGDLRSGARDIGRATELAPRFADAWDNLAAVHDAAGDSEAAAAARSRAQSARQ